MDLTGHLLYYQEGRHRINLNDYVQHNQLNKAMDTMNNSISEALKSKVDSITNITYSDLRTLRDNSQLTPGSLYRITDYNCTTTQENTRSAGHQFDIVLLALSADKLAEEGWAMMHDNIYDVTFADGVTKKCYMCTVGDNTYLVTTDLLQQMTTELVDFVIDEIAKTATTDIYSSTEFTSYVDAPYNYFQNSNLSAWKVWYCLDNDTARFAWADDSVDEDSPALLLVNDKGQKELIRDALGDTRIGNVTYYQWRTLDNSIIRYTTTQTPTTSDTLYSIGGGKATALAATILYFTPAHEGTGLPIGRGVIYRLIDEFNNDVPYDFKNIQYKSKIDTTSGEYDSQGVDTWVYTFNMFDVDNSLCLDGSLAVITVLEGDTECVDIGNVIKRPFRDLSPMRLEGNVFYDSFSIENESGRFSSVNTIINSVGAIMGGIIALTIIGGSVTQGNSLYKDVSEKIYIGGKQVLTET